MRNINYFSIYFFDEICLQEKLQLKYNLIFRINFFVEQLLVAMSRQKARSYAIMGWASRVDKGSEYAYWIPCCRAIIITTPKWMS